MLINKLYTSIIIEVNRYIDENILPLTNDCFSWWKEHSYNYPNLSRIVKEKCCVVRYLVPRERVFSKAGLSLANDKIVLNLIK